MIKEVALEPFCRNCQKYIMSQRINADERCPTCNTQVEWHSIDKEYDEDEQEDNNE